jgi:hypothetical protein
MRRRKSALLAVPVVASALWLGACGGPDVTQGKVDNAVAPTFAHLYQLQQDLIGRPPPEPPQASASCHRSGQKGVSSGAGDDWICQLVLQLGGPSSVYTYELNVLADGCYTADGPSALVGAMTLTTPQGKSRVNPLFEFDGCFDSW